jgi:pyrimidine-nucleoside phosphorylase
MSGRGLGYTGGTLDKLESIPGFRIDLSIDEFKQVLREIGTSIIGQTGSLAPADKALYALRDVTATIESIPLISASIMSKKLAEGSNALVLDVKCGDGAFMKDVAQATRLARSMVAIGTQAGVRTEAVISDMDAPLGRAIGNALEVKECIDVLKGQGPADLTAVATRLASRMLILGGVETDEQAARARVQSALDSGQALDRFARLVERQGGDPRIVEDSGRLPTAPSREIVRARRSGFVTRTRAEALGRASNLLGAGRTKVDDPVDYAVGLVVLIKPGDRVQQGDPLIEVHHRHGASLDAAIALGHEAVEISDTPPPAREKVLAEVR